MYGDTLRYDVLSKNFYKTDEWNAISTAPFLKYGKIKNLKTNHPGEVMATSRELYLDLMKKTLSFFLWPEPPQPFENISLRRSWFTRLLLGAVSKILLKFKLRMMVTRKFSDHQRAEGLVWPGYADTMIGLKRLDNLQSCVETVIKENIPGDLIETGVWRGGACIFMKAILKAYEITDRKIFVADSFEGLPAPWTIKSFF